MVERVCPFCPFVPNRLLRRFSNISCRLRHFRSDIVRFVGILSAGFFLAVARYTCDKQPVDNRTIPIQCPITIWAYFYFIHYGEVGNLPVIVL